jgi:aminopeptidase-like protein
VKDLYPVCRSISGRGLRETLARIGSLIPLRIEEVPSGSRVFDWVVPNEWNISEAYIVGPDGRRIVDFQDSNLHVVSYSCPIDDVMTLDQLRPHLHSLPDRPDWIPYRTTYYADSWGFCVRDRTLRQLPEGQYQVVIRSTLEPGAISIAEHLHAGASDEEVLVFVHTCHPSLCNDNLSGISVATYLAKHLSEQRTRYSYRFVFAPATIGSIAWLALNQERLGCIRHGLVLTLLGDKGPFHYKVSRRGNTEIDRIAKLVLAASYPDSKTLDFSPWGYDERQFGSPGIDLPIGRLTRTPNGEFAQYHTSADNLDFVCASSLGESWLTCLRVFEGLECNDRYVNLSPKGEPQLGRRGLYRSTGGYQSIPERQFALLWVLNQSDGSATLLDIAERSGLPLATLASAALDLQEAGLVAPC